MHLIAPYAQYLKSCISPISLHPTAIVQTKVCMAGSPDSTRGPGLTALCIVMIILSIFAVTLRVWSRLLSKNQRFWWGAYTSEPPSFLGTEIGSQCIIWKDSNACIPRHGFNLHHLPRKDCAELEISIDDWFAIASLVSWLLTPLL